MRRFEFQLISHDEPSYRDDELTFEQKVDAACAVGWEPLAVRVHDHCGATCHECWMSRPATSLKSKLRKFFFR